MDLKTFTTNFGLLADTPNGIPKLREMILQLAVMGKLVPQNPKDEPAPVLLKKIAAEKEKLIEEEKIKKSKPLPPNNPNELPYELPEGWNWSRLVELGKINPRNEADDTTDAAFIPMPLISDKYGVLPNFEVRPWKDIRKGFTHFAEGDVALAKITPCFQNGKSAVFERLPNGIGAGTTELHVFRPLGNTLIPKYVWLYLKSPRFLSEGETKMTGTAGQKRVPKMYFEGNPFPLPPLTEQKHIVSKVDELMALCDELEERQKKRDEVRVSVNAACLHEMTSPKLKISKKGWIRTRNHFDLLYDKPDNVAALRQTILQLAVMGRLVPQDPNDEPAAILLQKIATYKERLIAEGEIKKSEPVIPIGPDNVPYHLPEKWLWLRIQSIFFSISPGNKKVKTKDILAQGKYPVIDQGQRLIAGYIEDPEKLINIPGPVVVFGDHTRETKFIDFDFVPGADGTKILRPILVNEQYFYWVLKSYYLEDRGYGRHYKILRAQLFPLPPLAEQRRIVAKVDELMALCAELESKLQGSLNAGEKLMVAVVHEITEA